jgi:hypothetical protein
VVCTYVNATEDGECSMCTTPGPPLEERRAAQVRFIHMCTCICAALEPLLPRPTAPADVSTHTHTHTTAQRLHLGTSALAP